MNLRDSIHSTEITAQELEIAREELAWRLRSGRKVDRCTLFDLIDSELNGERYKIVLEEICGLLTDPDRSTAAKAELVRDGFIERYLSIREDLVQELAEEMRWES